MNDSLTTDQSMTRKCVDVSEEHSRSPHSCLTPSTLRQNDHNPQDSVRGADELSREPLLRKHCGEQHFTPPLNTARVTL